MGKLRILMSAGDIDLALKRIGLQILERNHGCENMAIVGIYTCGVTLARRLQNFIELQAGCRVSFGSLDINLYRDDWSLVSQNPVVKTTDLSFDVEKSTLVLVDDVIFTGRTIRAAMDAIMDYGRPRAIQLAALVDRGGRELPVQPDFTGMRISILDDERINVEVGDQNDSGRVTVES